MIYIDNTTDAQVIIVPANASTAEYVDFIPQKGDSDYYTKGQTDEKIRESQTATLGEVGDWLSHYPTTEHMHDAIEEAVKDVDVDLSAYSTKAEVNSTVAGLQSQISDIDIRVEDIENGTAGGGVYVLEIEDSLMYRSDVEQILSSDVTKPVIINDATALAEIQMPATISHDEETGEIFVSGTLNSILYTWHFFESDDSATPSVDSLIHDYYTKDEVDSTLLVLHNSITSNATDIDSVNSNLSTLKTNMTPYVVDVDDNTTLALSATKLVNILRICTGNMTQLVNLHTNADTACIRFKVGSVYTIMRVTAADYKQALSMVVATDFHIYAQHNYTIYHWYLPDASTESVTPEIITLNFSVA